MSQALPLRNFKWINLNIFQNVKEIEQMISDMADDAEHGCLLEVDLEYPHELHDLHNDLPFCCEHMVVGNTTEQKKWFYHCKINPNMFYIIELSSLFSLMV